MEPCNLKPGDVVQLNEQNEPCWIGCFLMVTEPKSFGCQGFVSIPREKTKPPGMAFLRPTWKQIERVDFRILRDTPEYDIIACALLQPAREVDNEEAS